MTRILSHAQISPIKNNRTAIVADTAANINSQFPDLDLHGAASDTPLSKQQPADKGPLSKQHSPHGDPLTATSELRPLHSGSKTATSAKQPPEQRTPKWIPPGSPAQLQYNTLISKAIYPLHHREWLCNGMQLSFSRCPHDDDHAMKG